MGEDAAGSERAAPDGGSLNGELLCGDAPNAAPRRCEAAPSARRLRYNSAASNRRRKGNCYMRTRIDELKGRMADDGRRVTWEEMSAATGIRMATLLEISKGRLKQWRPEYIDALCAYFGVEVGDLLIADPVALPLELNLRPDRRGKRVGE